MFSQPSIVRTKIDLTSMNVPKQNQLARDSNNCIKSGKVDGTFKLHRKCNFT